MLKGGQAFGVELVTLVDVGHHFLGEEGVGELGGAAGGLDLIDDPHRPGVLPGVPVADGLQGDRGAGREAREVGPDGAWVVCAPLLFNKAAPSVQNGEERVVLVGITTDRIIGMEHVAPPLVDSDLGRPSLLGGAALSNYHLAGWDRGCWANLA